MSDITENMTAEDKRFYVQFMRELYEGKHPYIIYGEQRVAVQRDVFKELALKQGKVVSPEIWELIMEAQLNQIQTQIDKKALETAKPEDFEDPK